MTNVYLKDNVIVDVASLNDIVSTVLKSGTADQIIVVKNKEDFGRIILKHGCSSATVWEHCFNIYTNWDQVTSQHVEDLNLDIFQEVKEEFGLLIKDIQSKFEEACKNIPDTTTTWDDLHKQFEDLKSNSIAQAEKIKNSIVDFLGQFKGK